MRGDLCVRAKGHRRTSDRRKIHGSLRCKRKRRGGKWAADGGNWAVAGGNWAAEGGDWAVDGGDWAADSMPSLFSRFAGAMQRAMPVLHHRPGRWLLRFEKPFISQHTPA